MERNKFDSYIYFTIRIIINTYDNKSNINNINKKKKGYNISNKNNQ